MSVWEMNLLSSLDRNLTLICLYPHLPPLAIHTFTQFPPLHLLYFSLFPIQPSSLNSTSWYLCLSFILFLRAGCSFSLWWSHYLLSSDLSSIWIFPLVCLVHSSKHGHMHTRQLNRPNPHTQLSSFLFLCKLSYCYQQDCDRYFSLFPHGFECDTVWNCTSYLPRKGGHFDHYMPALYNRDWGRYLNVYNAIWTVYLADDNTTVFSWFHWSPCSSYAVPEGFEFPQEQHWGIHRFMEFMDEFTVWNSQVEFYCH